MRLVTKKTHDYLPQLRKRLQELNKSTVEIGYFPTQRKSHYSGLTYAGLFAIHSFGAPSVDIPARPIMEIEVGFSPPNKNVILKRELAKYFSKISHKYAPIRFTQLLENLGGLYVQKIRSGFGSTTKLKSNSDFTISAKGKDSPLIWTGDLRDNLSYSINGHEVITPS